MSAKIGFGGPGYAAAKTVLSEIFAMGLSERRSGERGYEPVVSKTCMRHPADRRYMGQGDLQLTRRCIPSAIKPFRAASCGMKWKEQITVGHFPGCCDAASVARREINCRWGADGVRARISFLMDVVVVLYPMIISAMYEAFQIARGRN